METRRFFISKLVTETAKSTSQTNRLKRFLEKFFENIAPIKFTFLILLKIHKPPFNPYCTLSPENITLYSKKTEKSFQVKVSNKTKLREEYDTNHETILKEKKTLSK